MYGKFDEKSNTYKKHNVMRSKHLFRKLNAWGLDYDEIVKLPEQAKIEVWEREEDRFYRTTKEFVLKSGTIMHFKQDTKDHYTQLFLPLALWEKESDDDMAKRKYLLSMGLI